MYDDHIKPHSHLTHAQISFFISCMVAFVWWCIRWLERRTSANEGGKPDVESGLTHAQRNGDSSVVKAGDVKESDGVIKNDVKEAPSPVVKGPVAASFPPVPTMDETLRNAALLGLVMFYFMLCDYLKVLSNEERVYSRDQFLFLLFLLFLVASAFTLTPTKDKILNRDQTEEWKGWMQVMFVWYHYFAAKEWYNWIRVYIACYVWMTGFGNFSFFWVRGDYSVWRVLKMLFRMNFLVLVVMAVTSNQYMLYYICAMHTYWFLTVYLFMRVLTSWNTHRVLMAVKILAYIVVNAFIFEIPGNCSNLFRPLWFIFQFPDGVHDVMHEWEFRAGLDHWACLLGMLCAYNYPHYEAFITYLESPHETGREAFKRICMKVGVVLGAVAVGVGWYFSFMTKEKYDYNKTHCYTSLLFILVFSVLRNSFPVLRRYYVGLFAWLGKITLETYLSQLHVYLQSNAKHLLGYLRGYPLLNLAVATIVYLCISQVLFHLTLNFSAYFIQKDWRKAARLSAIACGVVLAASLCAFVLQMGTV
ncbi:hypothetical protein ACOMHN_052474 [Nucella lapillus]